MYRHLRIFVDVEFRFIYYVLIIIKIRVSIVGTENRKYADSLFWFISIHRYTHLLRQEIPIAHEWCTCNQATDNQESGHCARGYRFSSSLSSSPAGYHAFSRSSEILSPTKSGNWARVGVWSSMVYVRCARRQVRAFFRKEDSSLPAIFLSGTRYRGKGCEERERKRAKKDENIPRSGGGEGTNSSLFGLLPLWKRGRKGTGGEQELKRVEPGCRRERWYVRGIAPVFSTPWRFGLPTKGSSSSSLDTPPPSIFLRWSLVFKHLTIFFWILFFFESAAISDNSGLFRRIPTWRSLNWEQKVWRLSASDADTVRVDIVVYVLRGKENETFVFENMYFCATMSQK